LKQIIQSFKTGETILEEVPTPIVSRGQVLIKTARSLVSLGTERMLVEFGKASLIQKARQQPEKVQMVLDKIKSDGLIPTIETVFKKLGQPLPLGYCNAGEVIAVGEEVREFKVGDRVVSNGHHAEFVCIPQNLCAHIPTEVSYEEATFTVIGSIGLQGIRLLDPTLGETVVVTGLGLIGLMTAQLLKANGCNVVGIDIDQSKLDLAETFGIHVVNPLTTDVVKSVHNITHGIGADGVIITASAKTNDIISQAAHMSRKRGKIILVGVIGLNLSRADFYEKELSFQVSCSYGPGRYDDNYEQKGIDYPLPYVRWTEKRNFESILTAIDKELIDVSQLVTERIDLENYQEIYGNMSKVGSIASVIHYKENTLPKTVVPTSGVNTVYKNGSIAIVGAGNFTKMTMLPNLRGDNIKYIVSKGGLNAQDLAKKYKIGNSSTSYNDVLQDDEVSMVMITTRHNLHAEMIIAALKAGKGVFVEKPLALNDKDLVLISDLQTSSNLPLTVGFNRRFSPHIMRIKAHVPERAPKNLIATMNAGFIPQDVWIHDMEVGGGRIVGEACHFIDLLSFISGSKVSEVCMNAMGSNPNSNTDNASILLKFDNGDNGVINYFANGNKSYSKERIEVYFEEKTIVMDNFRETKAYGVKGFKTLKTKIDKGHKRQFQLLADSIKTGGETLIPFDSIKNTTLASFAALESVSKRSWIKI